MWVSSVWEGAGKLVTELGSTERDDPGRNTEGLLFVLRTV